MSNHRHSCQGCRFLFISEEHIGWENLTFYTCGITGDPTYFDHDNCPDFFPRRSERKHPLDNEISEASIGKGEPMELTTHTTDRGFKFIEGRDRNNQGFSIQESSLATESSIWFGIDTPELKVMTISGWRGIEIPSDAYVGARMHLTREHVAALLPVLQRFAETGELGLPETKGEST